MLSNRHARGGPGVRCLIRVGLAAVLMLPTLVSSEVAHAQQAHARSAVTGYPRHLNAVAIGPRGVESGAAREQILFPRPQLAHIISERGSRTKYVLWGAGVGGAAGLAVGIASYNNSRCTDCWVPNEAIPVYCFLLGASAGGVLGLLVHAMTPDTGPARYR